MTQAFFPVGHRATDADDNPLAGGYWLYFAAGTTTPKAVYSDAEATQSLGTRVDLNASGMAVDGANTPTMIYPGTGAYKARLYAANDTLIVEQDNLPGKEEDPAEVTTALPTTPVISKSSAYTVTENERGKLINANPTGGSFAITLPSAVTLGDNFRVGVRHNGSANQVSVISSGSQFVRAHKALRSYALTGLGEVAWFVSDGSDWIVDGYHPPFWKADGPYFIVLDRLTAPPANPDAGARYIINGAPTGLWNTLGFAEHDVAEADGNGSWIKLTPESGWRAFDQDEEQSLVFRDGQWENFQVDPGTSTLGVLVVQDQKASGTGGGAATTGAWTTAVLNTSVINTIDGASLASNKITLPGSADNPRTYLVHAAKTFLMTANSRVRIKTADDDSIIKWGLQARVGNYDANSDQSSVASSTLTVFDVIGPITAPTDFIMQYRVSEEPGGSNYGLGNATSLSSTPEVYATVSILDLSSLQGPKGDQGDQGSQGVQGDTGPAGVLGPTNFNFDSATTDEDPGSGDLRLNNATPASVTEIYIDNENRSAADVSDWLDTFDDTGASGLRGTLIIMDALAGSAQFHIYSVTGSVVDGTGYRKVSVTFVGPSGAANFTNGNELLVSFFPRGPAGSGLADVVDDTTPQLGGNLDLNSQNITGTGSIAITGTVKSQAAINAQTGTTYTLALTDGGCEVTMESSSSNTLTIPPNSSVAFPVGTQIVVRQIGSGVTTVDGDTGVTVNGVSAGGAAILARYAGVSLLKTASDTWVMSGAHGTVA